MDFPTLEQEALALPATERARLARDLLASLETLSDGELDALWLAEASARVQELESGKVEGIRPTPCFGRPRRSSVEGRIPPGCPGGTP